MAVPASALPTARQANIHPASAAEPCSGARGQAGGGNGGEQGRCGQRHAVAVAVD
ncbi:hypothetical protein [Streptomyces milbemycinicus]|uniref:Uncharacterized protein n=1 Tax=Streptomyces milbemycinicus TaxID=476552 RepID=A0ABW8LKV3_9ACTN